MRLDELHVLVGVQPRRPLGLVGVVVGHEVISALRPVRLVLAGPTPVDALPLKLSQLEQVLVLWQRLVLDAMLELHVVAKGLVEVVV